MDVGLLIEFSGSCGGPLEVLQCPSGRLSVAAMSQSVVPAVESIDNSSAEVHQEQWSSRESLTPDVHWSSSADADSQNACTVRSLNEIRFIALFDFFGFGSDQLTLRKEALSETFPYGEGRRNVQVVLGPIALM
ncbi:hypothetical protein D918_03488 [Trichuris suis]|nr:hypothetical protein D918_03488 [Trichuris suis]